jgi:hypothetical protein
MEIKTSSLPFSKLFLKMSYASSDEAHENLLPTEEQEKDDIRFEKPSPLIRLYRAIRKPRFCKNGLSILQQVIISLLLLIILRLAYIQGLNHPAPRSYRSFVPRSMNTKFNISTSLTNKNAVDAAPGPIKFEDSADWSGNTSQAASSWNKWLVNFETHTIAIPTPQIQEFGYEPGLKDFVGAKDYERFGIAMFHQLHCLVRLLYILLLSKIEHDC